MSLKARLAQPAPVLAPGVYDRHTARMAAQAGVEAAARGPLAAGAVVEAQAGVECGLSDGGGLLGVEGEARQAAAGLFQALANA
jgi:2-methylisocitrate lyase-like PEP mutase family enzyme